MTVLSPEAGGNERVEKLLRKKLRVNSSLFCLFGAAGGYR